MRGFRSGQSCLKLPITKKVRCVARFLAILLRIRKTGGHNDRQEELTLFGNSGGVIGRAIRSAMVYRGMTPCRFQFVPAESAPIR